jgi:excisionase family DNA binding protein
MIVVGGVEMVDVQEAARLAHRTPETIRRWVWSGRVRSVKHGNKLLVVRSQVDRPVGRATTDPTSLADWAAEVGGTFAGKRGSTARDLVLEDRAGRDTHAGR